MKKKAKELLKEATDAIITGAEIFNSPTERSRVWLTLSSFNHAFEMLMKAAIIEQGETITDSNRLGQTIGFDKCIEKGLNDTKVKFLNPTQAIVLRNINAQRDAVEHHLIDINERHLYFLAKSAITLFGDILKEVFNEEISRYLPNRVLPISTHPLTDIATFFRDEVLAINKLLEPKKRQHLSAIMKLRALAITNNAVLGRSEQPTDKELSDLAERIKTGEVWFNIFPGAATIQVVSEGEGPELKLRLTKNEGFPVRLVSEDDPSVHYIGVKRVAELGYYSFSPQQLADRLNLTMVKCNAMIWYLELQDDSDCYTELVFTKTDRKKRYSHKALQKIKEAILIYQIDEIWNEYKATNYGKVKPKYIREGKIS